MYSSLARMLLAAVVLAATFFGGYLMGGGKSFLGGKRVRGERDPLTLPALQEDPSARVGKAEPMKESQFGEIKRLPWTKERLLKAVRGFFSGGNEIASVRPISKFADQLEVGDFPLALEVTKDLSERSGLRDIYGYLMLMRWAELNPRAVAEYLLKEQGLESPFRPSESNVVFAIWARTDAIGAAAWARGLKDSKRRQETLEAIAQTVAGLDPDGAMAFVQAHAPELIVFTSDPNKGGTLPKTVMQAWKDQPPEEAARRVAAVNANDELYSPTHEWAKKDRAAALTWAQGLTDAAQRGIALHGVFSAWAEKDVAAAAAAFAKIEQPSGQLKQAGENIVQAWPGADFEGAAAWVQALPAGEARDLATAAVVERWADSGGMATWLEGLPEGSARDKAAGKFARAIQRRDREGAMSWTLSIGDPKERSEAFRGLARDWFQKDPAAAFDWMLGDDEILAEEKRELLGGK